MVESFTFFWKSRLSQWHHAPFVIGGIRFAHAEQYMMYTKALLFGDRDAAERVLKAATPREQQAIGRTVRGFDEGIWVLFREGIVYHANYARFSQNPEQLELLFATRGTTLVEASPSDQVWGIGLAADDPRALDRAQWRGLNLLGQALTRVREALLWEQFVGHQKQLDARTDEEWIAADEAAAVDGEDQAVITVPATLLPEIRRLLALHRTA